MDTTGTPTSVLYVGTGCEIATPRSRGANDVIAFETTAKASDALSRLSESPFECVVSEYALPDASGIELLETVRADHPDLPFILYTDSGSEEIASDATRSGVTTYLPKHRDTADCRVLREQIDSAVERYRSRRERVERTRELRRYKRVIEAMREAAVIYDEEGRFEFVNEYVAEWYGTTADALEGEYSGVVRAIKKKSEGDPFGELVDGERSELRGEVEVEVPDRGSFDVEYRLTPLLLEGEITGVTGIVRDVSERKDRERKLAFFKQLVETAGTGIGIYDETGRFIYVNRACEELLGVEEGTLEGMTVWELNPNFDRERFEAYWDSFSMGDVRTAETALSVGDTTVPVEAITTRQEIQGDVYHFGTISDRTAWREYERELERRNERLEQFASVVSHDLRSPLSVARGRLELARMEPEGGHFEEIERAHERMDALIENILTLAREGHAETDCEPVDVGELAATCWSTVGALGGRLLADIEQTILADETRLKRLLENLFRNAVEHGGADVTITVGALENGFYVEDDGPGIPESDRSAAFETGYSTDADGTGFGLAIVTRIVEAHGWDIVIVDGADGGARFEITGVECVDTASETAQ